MFRALVFNFSYPVQRWLGVIQHLRGQNFALFCPPPRGSLCVDSFYTLSMEKTDIY